MKHLFNRSLRILLATNAIILFAGAMLGPIYALFVEDIGGSLLDASIAGGMFALAAGITTLVSGRYADKIKENEFVVVAGYLIMALGFYFYIFRQHDFPAFSSPGYYRTGGGHLLAGL